MMRRLGTILLLSSALWTGCSSDDLTDVPQFIPVLFDDFVAAQPLQVTAPWTQEIRDQATWDAFWQAHAPVGGPAPAVDFSQDMLIGVFWGTRTNGCFSFVDAIERVRLRVALNTTGVIEVELGPLPDLGTCAGTVYPLQVISVDTTAAPVDFVGILPS